MRNLGRSILVSALLLTFPACDGFAPSNLAAPQDASPTASQSASPVVASASGGANWTLEVFGFTVPQVLGFQAKKFADGTVRGHINYHQIFQGERLRFGATVTCLSVYDGGTRAKYGGEITVSSDPAFPPGTFIWFQAIDNGEGAAAPADQSTGAGFGNEEENQAFCDSPAEPNPLFLAEVDGNIQVSGS